MVELGDEVRDVVSGFQGVAIASHAYLHGCRRITVQPPVDDEGKLPKEASFDEPQLEVIHQAKALKGSDKTGGPEKYSPSSKPTGAK